MPCSKLVFWVGHVSMWHQRGIFTQCVPYWYIFLEYGHGCCWPSLYLVPDRLLSKITWLWLAMVHVQCTIKYPGLMSANIAQHSVPLMLPPHHAEVDLFVLLSSKFQTFLWKNPKIYENYEFIVKFQPWHIQICCVFQKMWYSYVNNLVPTVYFCGLGIFDPRFVGHENKVLKLNFHIWCNLLKIWNLLTINTYFVVYWFTSVLDVPTFCMYYQNFNPGQVKFVYHVTSDITYL